MKVFGSQRCAALPCNELFGLGNLWDKAGRATTGRTCGVTLLAPPPVIGAPEEKARRAGREGEAREKIGREADWESVARR